MASCSYFGHFLILVSIIISVKLQEPQQNEVPVVTTTHGKVQGTVEDITDDDGSCSYFAYRGIPYAKPPLGELRFQPPQEPEPWDDVKNCTNFGNICAQARGSNVIGDEDCLFLNVYTSKVDPKEMRPVLFWVHGGSYVKGSSNTYPPDYYLKRPIVLVTANYRLGAFGFLSVNDSNAYGNAALKDVIAALEWVQNNVANFGGDPARVTLGGSGSGATIASVLRLSPKAPKLFHQLIGHSGTAITLRHIQRDVPRYTYAMAKFFKINNDLTSEVVKELQKIAVSRLVLASTVYMSSRAGYKTAIEGFPFMPTIEVEHEGAVITQNPYEAFEKGNFYKTPFIIGCNSAEAAYLFNYAKSVHGGAYDYDPSVFISQSFNNPNNKELGQKIRDHFFGNASVEEKPEMFYKFLTQDLYMRSVRKMVDLLRKYVQGYFYRFSYKGTHTYKGVPGVNNGEELQYFFPQMGRTENLTDDDLLTRKRVVMMWTNFVECGNPTPECECVLNGTVWCPVNDQEPVHFLDIGKTLELGLDPDKEDYDFWKGAFEKFGNPPFFTY